MELSIQTSTQFDRPSACRTADRIIDNSPILPSSSPSCTGSASRAQPPQEIPSPPPSPIGIPIGNLTSQFFANLYLSGFDHYILEHLKPQ